MAESAKLLMQFLITESVGTINTSIPKTFFASVGKREVEWNSTERRFHRFGVCFWVWKGNNTLSISILYHLEAQMLLRLQISYACHGRMITRLYFYCAIPAIVLGKTPLEILDLSVPLLLNQAATPPSSLILPTSRSATTNFHQPINISSGTI